MINKPLLLVIDDEITILKTLQQALEDENYRVETLSDGNKALDYIGKLIPDLVLLDIFMPNCNGIKLLQQITKEYPQQKVIMISGFGNIPIAIETTKKGALDFIEKPLNLDEILSKISFLKNDSQKTEDCADNNFKNLEQYGIIGQSSLFLELIHQVNQITKLQFPLLIYGQYGTGKTLLAKYIHLQNHNDIQNFYSINCLTILEEKIVQKINNALLNKQGTLFIKNIDNLSLKNQKNLLLAMEQLNKNNIRLIASSSSSLFKLLKEGKFNDELFHQLNSIPIEIPSLNKRRYDIPLLADYFLKNANKKYNKSIVFNNQSIRVLRNHNWRANVSELKTIIEKIVQTTSIQNNVITAQALTNYINEKNAQIIEEQSFLRFNSLQEAIEEFEKNFLLYHLKKTKYDLNQLSNRLNLTPIQLRDKMLKLNLEIKN